MTNIVSLIPRSAAPVPGVVDVLSDMLTRAKAGDVLGVYIVAVDGNKDVLRFFSTQDQNLLLLAGLQMSSHHLAEFIRTATLNMKGPPDEKDPKG